MAKTYLSSAKYVIHIDFEVDGVVDNPDMIGAIFGQSEGLLGDEMDLKELQKNGKIGRVEINTKTVMGKTKGEVTVPSSMDMAQTAVLAAAIESVNKVGPYGAEFKTRDIEDARSNKREEIKGRAQELLKQFMDEQGPRTSELTDVVREGARAAALQSYGRDKLPCGPGVFEDNKIIMVEGRADVINLLKNGVKNAVGIGGANISPTIIDLAQGKRVTAFLDGDRGGELILRKLQQMIKVDAVARAPEGKEVEELQRKEIVAALRKPEEPTTKGAFDKVKRFMGFGKRETRETRGRPTRARRADSGRGYRPSAGRGSTTGSRGYRTTGGSGYRAPPDSGRTTGSGYRASAGRGTRGPYKSTTERAYGSPARARSERTTSSYRAKPTSGRYSPRSGGYSPRGSSRHDSRSRGPPRGRGSPRTRREYVPREPPVSEEDRKTFTPIIEGLNGTLKAKLFDSSMKEIKEVGVRELVDAISTTPGVSTVVFDGIVTQRVADAAEMSGVSTIVGVRKGKVSRSGVKTIALST